MKIYWLVFLIAVSLRGAILVQDGRASSAICVARDASPADRRAAAELKHFLGEMSGAQLSVREDCATGRHSIFVGDSAALRRTIPGFDPRSLGPEQFLLHADRRLLVIAGGQPRGTLYGVYTLLDRLGCRWFTPEVARIPKRRTIEAPPVHETLKPAFEYREPFITEAFDKDWAVRNRTNGNSARLDESTGGKVEYYPFVHSFYQLIPPDQYFKVHPEYFSLIDGARRTERGQLCLTNPEVLKLAVARVRDWIREHPNAAIISVSQNDWEGWCECDRCRRVEEEEGGEHSGPILRFVNAVAAEIEKTHPDKLIDTLAYWYSENPPAHVRPRPNVRIRLCPIGVCVSHPYEQCPRSAYFLKNLRAWSSITNQLYIWHYNTNFSHYLAPFPDFDELAADIPLYRRNGVVGLFMEGSYPPGGGGENAELRAYVMARLLWDPSANVDREVNDFLAEVYGPAARPMREYFDLLHREVRMSPQGLAQHMWIFNLPVFSSGFFSTATRLFESAIALAGDPAIKSRVEKARLPLEYLQLIAGREYHISADRYSPADLTGWQSRYAGFVAKLRGFGISSIREGRSLAEDEKTAAEMKEYRISTIEDNRWRVSVAPDLGGRILRIFDKQAGREMLRIPNPGEGGYPDTGGQYVQASADYPLRPWAMTWKLARSGKDEIVLEGVCPNGLQLTRTIRIEAAGVHTEVSAANTTQDPIELVLHNRADLEPGDIDAARISFQSRNDRTVDRPVLVAGDQPNGSEMLTAERLPKDEWRLRRPKVEDVVVKFSSDLVERVTVSWTAKGGPRVSLSAASQRTRLRPNQTVRLTTSYGY